MRHMLPRNPLERIDLFVNKRDNHGNGNSESPGRWGTIFCQESRGYMKAYAKTVLIVDSNPTDLYAYSRALSEAGYRPITTRIGMDYAGMHENERPALVLLEYGLSSSVSAADLAKILRHIFPSTMIVVFSALTEIPSEMKDFVDGFIPKGDTARLIADVRNLLDQGLKEAKAGAAD